MPARIIFMGTPAFAVPSLDALLARPEVEVVGVVTREDKPAGRGRAVTPPPVKLRAIAAGLPLLQPKGVRKPEVQAALAAWRPDLCVVAAYGRILPPEVLALPRLGCLNVHASLLPRHRGASPIAHAILAGDPVSGVSLMQMDAGLDTGPVYRRAELPVPADATCGSLTEALAHLGAAALAETLPALLAGALVAEPQDERQATLAPLLGKEDGRLDFSGAADALERRVRAFSPWPGAFALLGESRLEILRAAVVDATGEAGRVLRADKHGVLVACGRDALRLAEVKPAGRKAMSAAAWVAGRGVAAGDRFASATT